MGSIGPCSSSKTAMSSLWLLLFLFFNNGAFAAGDEHCRNSSLRPAILKIGAILNLDSIAGRAAKLAIEVAVEDVNSNPDVLRGTKLVLNMQDNKYSGFLGIAEALKIFGTETVAIVGPQSSVVAHVVSHVANELQVPLLSFAATDPSLSSLQYPFFVRTTQNDLYQMTAIAEIVDFYGWREVAVIFIDDEFGRNGVAALGDKLSERRCKISYKAPMKFEVNRKDITNILLNVASMESRILVLHTQTRWGIDILDVAQHLGMMGNGYVWIATNWLSTTIDTSPLPSSAMNTIQGVLTLRMHTPDSDRKANFFSRWNNLTKARAGGWFGPTTYGLYAYDTVWLLAESIDAFFDQGETISFSKDPRLKDSQGGSLHLETMSIFNGGKKLLKNILQGSLNGLTGPVKFTLDGSLIHPAYDVLNVIGPNLEKIGYWSNYSGLSVVPPEQLYSKPPNRSSSNQQLHTVIWPGQTTIRPRGWVFPDNGRHLRIGVPHRVTYREFVSKVGGPDMIRGYCVDVFIAALKLLPYTVPYEFIPYGDGHHNPNYDDLVKLITSDVFDAVIGDIAIVTSRTRMVDFTQPYTESGLVVIAPIKELNAWAFLELFTPVMWSFLLFLLLIVGTAVWIFEHRSNDEFRGPPKKQVSTVLWFSFSTLFFSHRENTVSALGRFVMIIWLFTVLIITSSYTATLTSIMTVQQLSSPIKGIESLLASNMRIGFQNGSFVESYLTDTLQISKSRLVPLHSPKGYVKALQDGSKKGGVAAIVDERAYAELFLSSDCNFTIVGSEFTKHGWGFAFTRDSPVAIDMSTAILRLEENGELQRIHDKWLKQRGCSSHTHNYVLNQIRLTSFKGLFIMCGTVSFLALFVYLTMVVCQFRKRHWDNSESSSQQASLFARLLKFMMFVDKKEVKVKKTSRRRRFKSSPKGNVLEA